MGENMRRYCGVANFASASMAVTAMAMFAEMVLDHFHVLAGGAVDHQNADAHDDGQHAGQRAVQPERAQGAAAGGQRAAGPRGREFIEDHGHASEDKLAPSSFMQTAQRAGEQRPEQRADHRREPAAEASSPGCRSRHRPRTR